MENRVIIKPTDKGRHVLRWILTTLIVFSVVLAFFTPFDKLGRDYLDTAFERSLLSFAVARGLNGVLSVAQGTEFAIQPAGVGINFTPGEILDPVNDLVERFSWVMLLSSSSLGVQKILLSMSSWVWLTIGLSIIGLGYLASLWWRNTSTKIARYYLSRFFVLLMILRFSVPVVALLNEWVFEQFLSQQYSVASSELKKVSDKIASINEESSTLVSGQRAPDEPVGFLDQAVKLYHSALEQVDFDKRLERYKAAAEEVSENTINLIVVFVLQTIIFPLLFLWLIVGLFRRLINSTSL